MNEIPLYGKLLALYADNSTILYYHEKSENPSLLGLRFKLASHFSMQKLYHKVRQSY